MLSIRRYILINKYRYDYFDKLQPIGLISKVTRHFLHVASKLNSYVIALMGTIIMYMGIKYLLR